MLTTEQSEPQWAGKARRGSRDAGTSQEEPQPERKSGPAGPDFEAQVERLAAAHTEAARDAAHPMAAMLARMHGITCGEHVLHELAACARASRAVAHSLHANVPDTVVSALLAHVRLALARTAACNPTARTVLAPPARAALCDDIAGMLPAGAWEEQPLAQHALLATTLAELAPDRGAAAALVDAIVFGSERQLDYVLAAGGDYEGRGRYAHVAHVFRMVARFSAEAVPEEWVAKASALVLDEARDMCGQDLLVTLCAHADPL
jgi:hypothetical protein